MQPHDRPLAEKLASAGYTPGKRDVAPLVALIAATDPKDAIAEAALRALVRVPALAGEAVVAAVPGAADDAAVARLVRALGAVGAAGDDGARAAVIRILGDAAAGPRARRAAAVACGKLGGDGARAALLARWDAGDLPPDHRRAVVEALGKIGGADALARIRDLDTAGDPELARLRDRAVLMIERTGARGDDSAVAVDVAVHAAAMVATCRSGIEDLLAAELAGPGWTAAPLVPGAAAVRGTLDGPLARVLAARTRLDAAFTLPLPPGPDAELPARIAAALTGPIRATLAALTRGPLRWRLAFAGGGHKRGIVWRTAQAVRAVDPTLINDPTASTWEVTVHPTELHVAPRRYPDDRFAWRVLDVPAASHPTIAAALARLAGAAPAAHVWDPFVGSGAELIERDRFAAAAHVTGTDLDPAALDAARANLAAAGLADRATLLLHDARTAPVRDVDLILTNPPLGRRLRGDPTALLLAALPTFAAALRPGGRLLWITPLPHRTEPAARAAGLRLDHRRTLDLGGFDGTVERWLK
jgi:hypothetical protein